MRIVALAHQWIPQHCAGAEVMLHGMLRALVTRGHEVVVLLTRQDGEGHVLDGVRILPGAGDADIRQWIGDADVVVTHLENTPTATLLAKWQGKPLVQVLHNTMQVTRDWLHRGPVALAVYNSNWMRADFEQWAQADSRILPAGVVVRPPVNRAEYATTPGDCVTLINLRPDETSPGGAVMGKGAELFWQLAERMPDVKFLGVRGAYGAQLVRDLPNVEVLDHVPHHRMRDEVYARTRVLLMPSSYESWGRTAVEAMCSGIPVIAHPTPGLVESLGGAGTLLDRNDVGTWIEAIRALALPVYDVYSAAARRRALELDPTNDLARWCDAIESLER